jgi:hypothetical protein
MSRYIVLFLTNALFRSFPLFKDVLESGSDKLIESVFHDLSLKFSIIVKIMTTDNFAGREKTKNNKRLK